MNERQKPTTDQYRENYDSIFKKDTAKPKVASVDGGPLLPIREVCPASMLDEVAPESGSSQISEA